MTRPFALALLASAISLTPAFADYNVSGRFLYVDREFDLNGFTGVETQRPIRFAGSSKDRHKPCPWTVAPGGLRHRKWAHFLAFQSTS